MLGKVVKINHLISKVAEVIGFVSLFFIMVITCVDVAGAKIFNHPIFGSLDMVMMAQLIAISFAANTTLIAGRHVRVDFIVAKLPGILPRLVDILVDLAGSLLFALISWQLIAHGYHLMTGHEVTPTAHIPLHYFAYASALACIPVTLEYLLSAISGVIDPQSKAIS